MTVLFGRMWAQTIPGELRDQADQIVDQVKADPVLAGILVVVGIITALFFFWGIVKNAIKAAIVGGALSAIAWIWYFNIS